MAYDEKLAQSEKTIATLQSQVEMLRGALERANNYLVSLNRQFSSSNFTDRHGDADTSADIICQCEQALTLTAPSKETDIEQARRQI